jgi:hypothetical protein
VIVVLLFFYLDGPSPVMAFTTFFSLWVFQPGGSQIVFALPVMVLVTFFAPHVGNRLEQDPELLPPEPPLRGRLPVMLRLGGSLPARGPAPRAAARAAEPAGAASRPG